MRRRWLLILLLLAAAVLLWRSDKQSKNSKQAGWPTDGVIASLFRPVGALVTQLSGLVSESVDKYFFLTEVEEENQKLVNELDALRIQNAFLREELNAQKEYAQVRQSYLTGTAEAGSESLLPARILSLGLFYSSKTVIVDRGLRQGVFDNDIVLNGKGLVGRVLQAYENSSKVLLLIDPSFAVDAVNMRSGVRVIVSGMNEREIELERKPFMTQVEYLEDASEMLEGDLVATSGLGGIYPRGIPIGHVNKVSYSTKNLFDKAWVLPAVDFTKVTRVFVWHVTADEGQELAPLGEAKEPTEKKKPARKKGR